VFNNYFREEEEEDEEDALVALNGVEGGDLRDMVEGLGPTPSILPHLHMLAPNIKNKVTSILQH
jgi:hypothetical protein